MSNTGKSLINNLFTVQALPAAIPQHPRQSHGELWEDGYVNCGNGVSQLADQKTARRNELIAHMRDQKMRDQKSILP